MSGIVGVLNLDGASVDLQLLSGLTNSLKFRGPDAQAIWARDNIGLGHALLQTDEANPVRGPIGLDGEIWITADARLDAREALIRKLESKGEHGSKQAGDPELILRAYRLWQWDCLQHIAGDFTFVIWDDRRKQMVAARDPLGVKPLYYSQVGATLVMSNTLNCVRLHPAVSSDLDELAVADFLLFGHNEDLTSTTFAAIRRVQAGHLLYVTAPRSRAAERPYWTFTPRSPIRYRREEEYVEHFVGLLRVAVEDRVRGSNCAIYMSGGLDSAAVAASAKQVLSSRGSPRGLKALTWVYDHLVPHDERVYAGLIARHLDVPICYYPADDFSWFDKFGEPDYRTPEPLDDPGYSLSLDLYRAAADQARVVLSGDDGDSLFRLSPLVSALRVGSPVDVARDIIRYVKAERRRPPLGLGFLRLARHRRATAPTYPQWLNPDLEQRWSLRERFGTVWSRWRESGHDSPNAVPACYRQPLHQSVWESQDPGFTRQKVEQRLPLLDLRVISFVLAIPAFQWYPRKRLLRVAMRQQLPREVWERPKTAVPGYWEARLRQPELAARMRTMSADPEMSKYVRRDAIPVFDPNAPVDDAWSNLRPWLLNQWLMDAGSPDGLSFSKTEVAC